MNLIIILAILPFQSLPTNQTKPAQSPLQVIGTIVVFYSPSPAERDSIVRAEGLDTGALFDDFDYYAGKASIFLNGNKIPVQFTSSPVILVKIGKGTIRKYERKTMPELVGVIITDGSQEPRFITGVATDEELIDEFKDFFHLE